ncbi:MAG: 2-C-methyl-D-erythritol 4-phosphate cytidylyltransferase [Bacteroidales bacterium]|nr:2-C-methyl-D-erythritol 4-phosphate cytidylyltransferase [Bacteroidales bacterium]MBQ4474614.1 2-C-methyl-D-erythritol 4-phosphate cytidylyltransferase [Bacteroidales bacterium]
MKRKNIAVVLAGGSGRRIGGDLPKQFLQVGGRRIIEYSIEAFEKNAGIDEIAVVVNKDFVSLMEEIAAANSWSKLKHILNGGNERSDSSMSAIRAYEGIDCNLIFHDAVRPMVSQRIISDVVSALETYNSIAVAVPATDTIVKVDESGRMISEILQRQLLRCQQTPQAFRYETIAQAYKLALVDPNFVATDDCGVVSRYLPNEKIFIVDGEDSNIKVTYPKDLSLLENLISGKGH